MFQLVVRQRGLPETDARWYFQQLIIAIDYCHRMVSHGHSWGAQAQHYHVSENAKTYHECCHPLHCSHYNDDNAACCVPSTTPVSTHCISEFRLSKETLLIFTQHMQILNGAHNNVQGVANRDIKLENTLLDSTTRPLIKICDFGYSKVETYLRSSVPSTSAVMHTLTYSCSFDTWAASTSWTSMQPAHRLSWGCDSVCCLDLGSAEEILPVQLPDALPTQT